MTTGRAQWVVGQDDMAYVGDTVTLNDSPDTSGVITGVDPGVGVPIVEITSGPRTGRKVSVWPSRIATITDRGALSCVQSTE